MAPARPSGSHGEAVLASKPMRRTFGLIAAVLVVAVVVAACGGDDEASSGFAQAVDAPSDRRDAPELSVPRLDGSGDLTLEEFAGTPVVLNFWASWCGPCRTETPALIEFANERPEVKVVGVAVDDDPDDSRRFAEELDIPYDLATDRQGGQAARFQVQGLPVTVIVDADGRVVTTWFGEITREDLDLFADQVTTGGSGQPQQ